MINLEGQSILVTGANRGIGASIAEVLLQNGARVAAHYNTGPGQTEKLKEKFGDRIAAFQADLQHEDQIDRLWQEVMVWSGELSGVVNNAALMASAKPEDDLEAWRDDWSRTLSINLQAVADICRYAILHFRERGGGSIVNIASRAAFRGDLTDSMHYAASKGGVVALTRSIAKGYAQDNILAYTIAPGWVMTERVRPKLEAPGNERLLDEVPMKKAAPPEEIANAVAFLLSGLAKNATGTTFDINGASYFH